MSRFDFAPILVRLSIMKLVYGLVIFVITLGCKKEVIEVPPSSKEVASVDENDLTTRLFKYYIPNPEVLGHFEENEIIDYAIEHNLDLTRSDSGLYYWVVKNGAGEKLHKREKLKVDYKGTLLSGQVFDSSYDRGKPIEFNIGEMIAGWNEGLRYMHHGDEAILIIPSRLGYGVDGYPGYVPPNSILRFDMKIY